MREVVVIEKVDTRVNIKSRLVLKYNMTDWIYLYMTRKK